MDKSKNLVILKSCLLIIFVNYLLLRKLIKTILTGSNESLKYKQRVNIR
jgi:hypothetical protein